MYCVLSMSYACLSKAGYQICLPDKQVIRFEKPLILWLGRMPLTQDYYLLKVISILLLPMVNFLSQAILVK